MGLTLLRKDAEVWYLRKNTVVYTKQDFLVIYYTITKSGIKITLIINHLIVFCNEFASSKYFTSFNVSPTPMIGRERVKRA